MKELADRLHKSNTPRLIAPRLNGVNVCQQQAVSVVISTQQVLKRSDVEHHENLNGSALQQSETGHHEINNGFVRHETTTVTSCETHQNKQCLTPYVMEPSPPVSGPVETWTEQSVACCVICGGPLATRVLRESKYPVTGQSFFQPVALNPKLDSWLYQKTLFAVSAKKLIEDSDYVPVRFSDLVFLRKSDEDFAKYEDMRTIHSTIASSDSARSRLRVDDGSKVDREDEHDSSLSPASSSNVELLPDLEDLVKQQQKHKMNRQPQDYQTPVSPAEADSHNKPTQYHTSTTKYAGFPMHIDCCHVTNQYINVSKSKNPKITSHPGPSSWAALYNYLKTYCSQHPTQSLASHHSLPISFPTSSHPYQNSTSPLTNPTTYLLSKLLPLPHSILHCPLPPTALDATTLNLPPYTPCSPWLSTPIYPGSLQALLLSYLSTEPLPEAILSDIRASLHNKLNKQDNPTYLPEYHREILLRAIPWLWDLDHCKVRDRDSQCYEDGSKVRWNWEALVKIVVSDGGLGVWRDVPGGVGVRWGIWRVLERCGLGEGVGKEAEGGGWESGRTTERTDAVDLVGL